MAYGISTTVGTVALSVAYQSNDTKMLQLYQLKQL